MNPLVGVDLFAGAGGMSLGAREAGIEVALAVDHDRHALATYGRNHAVTTVVRRDVREFSILPFRHLVEGRRIILFGGPPCSGFSYSNQRTRDLRNPSNWLFLEFLRVAEELRPDWVVVENVRGLVNTKGGYFLRRILAGLHCLGLSTTVAILNAADFGVPQHRWRVFVVGSGGKAPEISRSRSYSTPPTVYDALHDMPALKNGANVNSLRYSREATSEYARRLRGTLEICSNHLVTKSSPEVIERYGHVPPGGNWENIPKNLFRSYRNPPSCHTGLYHRLAPGLPSKVIGNFRKNMLIHPTENRGISVREAARLQSFPDWYEFVGSIGFQQQQVSNAVPPFLAKAVFDWIKEEAGT